MSEAVVDREELLRQLGEVRAHIREQVGVPALILVPTKQCDRLVAGLLDALNNLEGLLRSRPS